MRMPERALRQHLYKATFGSLFCIRVLVNNIRQSRAATDYLSELPPGYVQSSSSSLVEKTGVLKEHYLTILSFKVYAMDWLALSNDGHRRAKLTPSHSVEWLVP